MFKRILLSQFKMNPKDTKAVVARTLRFISQHKQGDDLTFDNPSEKRLFMQHMDAYDTHPNPHPRPNPNPHPITRG